MIRILIADDSPAIRDALTSLLSQQGDFEVVGLAGDGLEAVQKAGELLPDVVLMDAQMPNMDGVEATRQIKQTLPGVGVLSLSVFANYLEASKDAGAEGYLMKDCEPEELFAELRRIAAVAGDNRKLLEKVAPTPVRARKTLELIETVVRDNRELTHDDRRNAKGHRTRYHFSRGGGGGDDL